MKRQIIIILLVAITVSYLWCDTSREERLIGSWAGYVYNANTLEPLENVMVYLRPHDRGNDREYYTVYTDESGYFELTDIQTDAYDVRYRKWMYYDLWELVGIYEGDNGVTEVYLQKAIGSNYTLYFIPDDYYYESSWGLQNTDEAYWYHGAAQGFSSSESVREFVYLKPGNWVLHLYDSYGDGGLCFTMSDVEGVEVLTGGCSSSHCTFNLYVSPVAGDFCSNPKQYSAINDPPQIGECHGRQEIWYEFYLDSQYSEVTVSLLNSDFDTVLEVWQDCSDPDYIAYNDNWLEQIEQSQIIFETLAVGYYYAKISCTDDNLPGYYELEITGNPAMNYGDVDNNGVVEAYDASNILQYVVELDPVAVPLPWDEITLMRANVDGNAFIGAYDASLILQYVAGVIDFFPVELVNRIQEPNPVSK